MSAFDSDNLPSLPSRPPDGHKGTFGTVLVIGGCDVPPHVMIGAPALAATAALRAGCGLAKLAMPQSILPEGILAAPSATGLAMPQLDDGHIAPSETAVVLDQAMMTAKVSCIAIGPGWGVGYEQQQVLARLGNLDECPLVIDADGLNNLVDLPGFSQDMRAPMVLTPHPGEFARLAQALNMTIGDVAREENERIEAAGMMAQRLGCTVVLKGAGTVVSDGADHWVCPVHNPALATAGTGDVLTGIIASFVAQHWKPHMGKITPIQMGGLSLFDSARWGVLIHAKAADAWSNRHGTGGMLASDLLDAIPDTIRKARAAVNATD